MKISKIKVGLLKCNCYLIENGEECLLIDPGDDYLEIKEFIKDKKIVGILLTHSHFDHSASVDNLCDEFGYCVYSYKNLDEGKFNISSFNFEVIKTDGHTRDCLCFYFEDEKIMFTGDFLFKGTIGRCDLLESNFDEMRESLIKISKYDDDIKIYPGHGTSSELGYEKKNNPYFRG